MGQKMMDLEPWDTNGLYDLKKSKAVEVSVSVTVNKHEAHAQQLW